MLENDDIIAAFAAKSTVKFNSASENFLFEKKIIFKCF